jgi:hypothetical protein
MGNCKNCKHWIGQKQDHMRTCEHPKIRTGYHEDPKSITNDGALIEDDEGWGWYVGPDFGCVHFETKVNSND